VILVQWFVFLIVIVVVTSQASFVADFPEN
jgi:hypothetical protein